MKYRDIITLFVALAFVLTLAYAVGVNMSLWFVPLIFFVLFVVVIYTLWIKK